MGPLLQHSKAEFGFGQAAPHYVNHWQYLLQQKILPNSHTEAALKSFTLAPT